MKSSMQYRLFVRYFDPAREEWRERKSKHATMRTAYARAREHVEKLAEFADVRCYLYDTLTQEQFRIPADVL